jgi:acyl-CoA thioesterase-1
MLAALVVLALVAAGGAAAGEKPVKLVAFGDSLTAGYGVAADAAFPARLQAALRARGHAVTVVNAGVSGDTASGGLDRLDWSIPDDADAVIVELGANDALRGIDPETTRKALDRIVARLQEKGISVLLAGMRAPPNMGADYAARFDALFAAVAQARKVPLYPFFLDGVAGERGLNQADGMHPLAAGVDVIVARILPAVEALLASAAAKPRG